MSWKEVPHGYVHGVLLGYRLQYKTVAKSKYITQVMRRGTLQVLLTGLLKYTEYDIMISAFTRVGDGPNSAKITVRTDEDGKF